VVARAPIAFERRIEHLAEPMDDHRLARLRQDAVVDTEVIVRPARSASLLVCDACVLSKIHILFFAYMPLTKYILPLSLKASIPRVFKSNFLNFDRISREKKAKIYSTKLVPLNLS
jgi:hypothetical protein